VNASPKLFSQNANGRPVLLKRVGQPYLAMGYWPTATQVLSSVLPFVDEANIIISLSRWYKISVSSQDQGAPGLSDLY